MDKKTLDDDELGVLVDQKASDAIGWFNSKLSLERENVIRYYNGELPKPVNIGRSKFISSDVYDGIESMKAQILETFSGNNSLVHFDPDGGEDIADCRIATKYTEHVIFVDNNGYALFSDIVDDGLKARNAVMEVHWEEKETFEDSDFDDLEESEVTAMASHPDIHSMEAEELHEGSGRYKGKATKKLDQSQVRLEVVNPEEFSVEPQAKRLEPGTFCVKRTIKTIDELVQAGYDRKKLLAWNAQDDVVLKSNPEVLARFQQIDAGVAAKGADNQDEMRNVLINECYIKCLRKGDDHAKLYKVVRLGNQTLDAEEVECLPFIVFVPLPIPHSFYGNNFGARIIPAQNARTVLTRSILDHTQTTTNARLTVLKGGVLNPKELLDNRLGGVINITRPDAVQPLHQAPLNPFVFQTLGMVKANNEETTGISSLSQGLNKDALSKQNSEGMVEKLVSLGQTRQKVIARNFANNFLIPLYIMVYNLVLTKQKRKRIIDIAGEWHEIDVSKWKERRSASASLHLGYGDQARAADELIKAGQIIAQDPALNRMFLDPGRLKMAKDIFELKGIPNILDYLTPPDKLPPQQPDPMKMKQMELEERKVAALEMQAKASNDKVDMHGQIEASREKLAQLQKQFDNAMRNREEDRKDNDIANKIDVSQREMAITEKAPISTGVVNVSPR